MVKLRGSFLTADFRRFFSINLGMCWAGPEVGGIWEGFKFMFKFRFKYTLARLRRYGFLYA